MKCDNCNSKDIKVLDDRDLECQECGTIHLEEAN